jgi:hypothetical protein
VDTQPALDDPTYRAAVLDLLGIVAYGELTAFERLAGDCAMAPALSDKASLAALACTELRHYGQLRDYLVELGADPEASMQPYIGRFDAWHESTAPSDWLEGLMKAYVGDSIAADFYREIAQYLDERTGAMLTEVLGQTGYDDFARQRLLDAIAADPRVSGRLALWGRRLMGEALSQAQAVAAESRALEGLFVGTPERPGLGLNVLAEIFTTIQTRHTERMAGLGLHA